MPINFRNPPVSKELNNVIKQIRTLVMRAGSRPTLSEDEYKKIVRALDVFVEHAYMTTWAKEDDEDPELVSLLSSPARAGPANSVWGMPSQSAPMAPTPSLMAPTPSRGAPMASTPSQADISTPPRFMSRAPSRGGGMTPGTTTPSRGGGMTPRTTTPSRGGGMTPRISTPSRGGGMTPRISTPSRGGGMTPSIRTPSRLGSSFTPPEAPRAFTTTPVRFFSEDRATEST